LTGRARLNFIKITNPRQIAETFGNGAVFVILGVCRFEPTAMKIHNRVDDPRDFFMRSEES
jgi:hypothetical protein